MLAQNDLLLRIWCRIYTVAKNRQRTDFMVVGPVPFGPVEIHRKIVCYAKNPRSQVILRALLFKMPYQPEECFLDRVLRMIVA